MSEEWHNVVHILLYTHRIAILVVSISRYASFKVGELLWGGLDGMEVPSG